MKARVDAVLPALISLGHEIARTSTGKQQENEFEYRFRCMVFCHNLVQPDAERRGQGRMMGTTKRKSAPSAKANFKLRVLYLTAERCSDEDHEAVSFFIKAAWR